VFHWDKRQTYAFVDWDKVARLPQRINDEALELMERS